MEMDTHRPPHVHHYHPYHHPNHHPHHNNYHNNYYQHPHHHPSQHHHAAGNNNHHSNYQSNAMLNSNNNLNDINRGKQLMGFTNYVKTLHNNVDETTAYKKYKDFMANLIQTKFGRFFEANKDREWFKVKYHPVDSLAHLQERNLNYQKRLAIFQNLEKRNYFHDLRFSMRNFSKILNLMDAIAINLDDGPTELVDQLLALADSSSQDDSIMIDSDLKNKYIPQDSNSVVIYDLDIETTLSEIQDLCKQASPNLMRIAQLDPYYVEGGNLKRKFIAVYEKPEEIKDICWKLSRMKRNNNALNVAINKCLTKRVHSITAVSNHFISVVNDIRCAIILTLYLDELRALNSKRCQAVRAKVKTEVEMEQDVQPETLNEPKIKQENDGESGENPAPPPSPPGSEKSANDEGDQKLFDVNTLDEEEEKAKKKFYEFRFEAEPSIHQQVVRLNSVTNNLLEKAPSFLIDVVESAAAQYYLSKVPKELLNDLDIQDLKEVDSSDKYESLKLLVRYLPCDLEESTRFLDKLLWYLRIVHSFDFYKKKIYNHEDESSVKMSVIHLRDEAGEQMAQDDDEDGSMKSSIIEYLQKSTADMKEFERNHNQKFVTKDEERFNYRSYGKVITDELTSYTQRQPKPKSTETEEVYKCKHCTRVFAKLADIGRHFVSRHRWAIDALELETDFFNAYLFDSNKIDPCPPKELVDKPPNRFANMINMSQMNEDSDLLQQTMEEYRKMESFVREPAPRAQLESDPRNETIVDYTDISFDDAI